MLEQLGAWNLDTAAPAAGEGSVTIVEGSSFAVSSADGDMDDARPHGVFANDIRIISHWRTRVNGHPIQSLGVSVEPPHRVVFVGRVWVHPHDGVPESSLIVERDRSVGAGLREVLTLHNYSSEDVTATVEIELDADFADVFDVKASRPLGGNRIRRLHDGDSIMFESGEGDSRRGVVVSNEGSRVEQWRLVQSARIPARSSWAQTLHVLPTTRGQQPVVVPGRALHELEVERRYVSWHADAPRPLLENDAIENAIRQGQTDIGSLRIFDPEHTDRAVVAAGAPWFMALFGRDSILTSLMMLPVDSSLALGTLQTLGDLQGSTVDPTTEEQPGKILHEVRFGTSVASTLGGKDTYFGSIDATPLFVIAVEALARWGLSARDRAGLIEHADRALTWITEFGDVDNDGFVEYERTTSHGLANQGWKDSWDAIAFADGTLAEAPIALCEVQGYVYSAYRARAALARRDHKRTLASRWDARAARLKREFNARFWLPDRKYFALALDAQKRPVDACASNMGQCLWSGIIDRDKAGHVVERLMSDELFGGWGIRTLASDMARYNPSSYHNGSVWPHDNALIAEGLMRYGFVEEAQKVALALFDAAGHYSGRLPELFCGFSRQEYANPVSYPNACTPQAWAAATPFSLMRTLLGFDVDVPGRRVWLDPALPTGFGGVRVDNLNVGGRPVSIEVGRRRARVLDLPAGYRIRREPPWR